MKCSQEKCNREAVWSYVWPGDPRRMFACNHCYHKANGISSVLGCSLGDVMLVDRDGNRSIFDDVDEGE